MSSVVETLKELKISTSENTLGVKYANENFDYLTKDMSGLLIEVDYMGKSSSAMQEDKVEVLNSVSKVSTVASHNASVTQQVSASIEEQNATLESVLDTSIELSKLALNLKDSVQKFKM